MKIVSTLNEGKISRPVIYAILIVSLAWMIAAPIMTFAHAAVSEDENDVCQLEVDNAISEISEIEFDKTYGTGLDSATLQDIIQQTGNSIWTEDETGEADTFYFAIKR